MSSKTYQIVLTMNAKQVEGYLDTLERRSREVRKEMETMALAGKTDDDKYRALNKELKILQDTIKKGKTELKDYSDVLKDLSGTKLLELRRALRQVKAAMDKTSENSGKMGTLRDAYSKITNQIKKMGVEWVNVSKVMTNLSSASEKQLRQALAQTKELHAETSRTDASYKDQINTIKILEAELSKISGKKDLNPMDVMGNLDKSTVNEIKETIDLLEKLRGNTVAGDAAWKNLGDQIKKAKAHLEKFSDTKKAMTLEQASAIGNGIGIDEKTIAELKEAVKVLEQAKENLRPSDTSGLNDLDRKIEAINKKLGKTADETDYVAKVLKKLETAPLDDLKKAAAQLEKEMGSLERNTDAFREKNENLSKIREQINSVNEGFKKQGNVIMQVMKRLSAYVLIYSGFNLVKDKLFEVVKKNLELSDSLADVRKTTGLANEEVERLADNLLKLDTRTTAEELNNLAYQAGRMGVGKYGVEGVEGFVNAANKINVALGEDLGENSIEQVYKLADVMGVIPKLGVENSLLSIGSALNELVQTGTSSGEFIVDFTSRMAGIAAQANLTTAEVAGFGSALDEMGQEVEVSATSMNKFVMQMFTHYSLVAKAADMSEEALKSMLENGQTADAIVAVMEGLSRKGGLSMLAPLFKDLGSDGARLSQTLAAMSSNVDKLKSSLSNARAAFDEARSVTNEYNIKNETTAALLERISNSWSELFVNSKNKGAIHEFVKDLKDMSDSLQSNALFIKGLELVFGMLVISIKALIALLPSLAIFLAGASAWYALNGAIQVVSVSFNLVKLAVVKLTGANLALNASTKSLIVSWKGLNTTMKGNVFIAIASVIIGLIAHFSSLNDQLEETYDYIKKIDESYSGYTKSVIKAKRETDGLFRVLTNAKSTEAERAAAMKQLNEEYGEYLPHLITEKDGIDEIRKAQVKLNEELRKGLAFRAKNKALTEALDPIYKDMADSTNNYESSYQKQGQLMQDVNGYQSYFSGYSTEVFEAAVSELAEQGKDVETIFSEVLAKAKEASGTVGVESKTSLTAARKAMIPLIQDYVRLHDAINRINQIYDKHIGDYGKVVPKKTKIVEDDEDEKKKKAREEGRTGKTLYDALKGDIEAFFHTQMADVKNKFAEGKITESMLNGYTKELEMLMYDTLASASDAVHSGTDEGKRIWDRQIRDIIVKSRFDMSDVTGKIVESILGANTKNIHGLLSNLGEAEMDGVRKQGAKYRDKSAEGKANVQKEVNRLLLENNYLGLTADSFQKKMETLGLMKGKSRLDFRNERAGFDSLASGDFEDMWMKAIKHIREEYEELFYIDIDTKEGMAAFRQLISPLSKDFPEILEEDEDRLKLLYRSMLDFHDADDEARRKAVKNEAKLLDFRFGTSQFSKDNEKEQQKKQSDMGWNKTLGEVGLSTDALMADQEVELYKLKLEAAAEYYEFVMTHAKEKENQDKAQQMLDQATMEMTEKLVAKVGEHLAYLKEYGDAIADFGTDFGAAIFGTLEDRQKTIENLAKAFAKTTQKIIMDWVKQRISKKLNDKLMEKDEKTHQQNMSKSEEEGLGWRKTLFSAFSKMKLDVNQKTDHTLSEEHEQSTAESVSTDAKGAQAKASLFAAQGAAKTIGELGWWGIPLVAVITALINGLISAAMSKVSSLFGGGGEKKVADAAHTKIVSGMLTYDSGNTQELSSYVGTDGVSYTVTRNVDRLDTGLVTSPIATMVNGQPSLVGEKGPELVIGRETTSALMMNRPDLVRYLIDFDRNYSGRRYRTYDEGNLSQVSMDGSGDQNAMLVAAIQELNVQLQRGIRAHINKFGKGGLVDEVVSGMLFEADNGNDPNVRRFLNRRS